MSLIDKFYKGDENFSIFLLFGMVAGLKKIEPNIKKKSMPMQHFLRDRSHSGAYLFDQETVINMKIRYYTLLAA